MVVGEPGIVHERFELQPLKKVRAPLRVSLPIRPFRSAMNALQ